jgi:hypothetical protein
MIADEDARREKISSKIPGANQKVVEKRLN